MTPDAERFIELAIRPLGDNAELRLSAEVELRKSIEAYAADRPEALVESVASLERADRHPKLRYWRMALYVLTLVVSLPLFVHSLKQMIYIKGEISLIGSLSGGSSAPMKTAKMSPDQKLLLYGDEDI